VTGRATCVSIARQNPIEKELPSDLDVGGFGGMKIV